jgi:hypothetical protein
MIDFKKKMEERKQKNQARMGLAVTGAIQTLLNLAPEPPKFSIPEQREILVCQCCGHTWSSSESDKIKKAWAMHVRTVRGPLCDICWHLYSVMSQAHARKLSLKQVVFAFLRGMAKQLRKDWNHLWQTSFLP